MLTHRRCVNESKERYCCEFIIIAFMFEPRCRFCHLLHIICCFCVCDMQSGKMCTDDPVFSTCSVVHISDNAMSDTDRRVLSGSHDKCVYCWDGHYELDWKLQLDSEVYSTPCVCCLSHEVGEPSPSPLGTIYEQFDLDDSEHDPVKPTVLACVCVCSSAGYIYLIDFKTGRLIGSYHLPGEVFSSPVVFGNSIIVGCRDDYVYCVRAKLMCVS